MHRELITRESIQQGSACISSVYRHAYIHLIKAYRLVTGVVLGYYWLAYVTTCMYTCIYELMHACWPQVRRYAGIRNGRMHANTCCCLALSIYVNCQGCRHVSIRPAVQLAYKLNYLTYICSMDSSLYDGDWRAFKLV